MTIRSRVILGLVAVLPLTLMAQGLLTDQTEDSVSEEFQLIDLVPRQSAGSANSFYTAPPLPY
jgi:hypothetical protein